MNLLECNVCYSLGIYGNVGDESRIMIQFMEGKSTGSLQPGKSVGSP